MRATPRAGVWVALLAAALLAGAGCAPRGDGETAIAPGDSAGQAGATMSDADFDKVELDTFEESAGTPKAGDDFEGILIAMPAKLSAGSLDHTPLCGVWSFNNKVLGQFPIVEDSLVFLARNVQTHETATGHFRMHEDPASPSDMQTTDDAPPAPPDRSGETIADEDITTRGYFNYNLGRVWKLPARPGHWRLHLVLHDVQSNEVEFEVVK